MKRWVVFDSSTAKAAQQPDRSVELHEHVSVSDAIGGTVQAQRSVVVVLPAGGDHVTVARITPADIRTI